MNGYSITFVGMSWKFGRFDIRKKTLWALGPFRFGVHRGLRTLENKERRQ